ncbi:MAG: class I SAM-dependent methyltransferase [Ruminococcaceae bacterium]|nr:class I SAM-dependent methyltransferase [Oscillospiraceae bacterium]
MQDNGYSALSAGYDILNSETDYEAWADFLTEVFRRFGNSIESVLDLGCGTGAMTFALHSRGYDMTGVDLSIDMLSVAREECYEREITDILWLLQDMRSFELYGTVNAAVCCLDGINHLTGKGDIAKCFATVHNYLDPDGLFVFDVNTPHKFENFYSGRDYILEDEGVLVCWQNDYDKEKALCDFYLSVFEETENGLWQRSDEVVRERCYSEEELCRELEAAGFEVIGVFGDFSFGDPAEDCDRWYIVARCKK